MIKDPQNYDWASAARSATPETMLFINGKFTDAADGGRLAVTNPATGEPFAEAAAGNEKDIGRAVSAASAAHKNGVWRNLPPRKRAAILQKFADNIKQNAATLAVLDTLCMGKPIAESYGGDIPEVAKTVRFFAESIDKAEGKVTNTRRDVLHYVLREPLGVVGAVSPWNYPALMAAWKFAPALAAGNTVVLKPAEQAPLSCLLLAKLFSEAGAPDGVFNVVNGFGEIAGQALGRHPDVAKISFTGSTEVGKKMLVYAGESNMKRVGLECGGKSPQIFLDDMPDIAAAAEAAAAGIFANAGQVCNAGSRLLVDGKLHDEFAEKF
ncbi:MAG: aldehyde dehydrogenase family protein, partial [Betaproteobacteria bacterium]|nr:aldehyde dehydrogenase family protein [Betaproteobacteria bacterium]